MTKTPAARVFAAVVLPALMACGACGVAGSAACGGAGGKSPAVPGAGGLDLRAAKDRPAVVAVARDGDPRGAIAVAVMTAGVDAARGADVAVALAGLVEARLRAAGQREVTVVTGARGYRVRAFVAGEKEAASFAAALRVALLAPVAAAESEPLAAAQRKIVALARRPLPDAALADVSRCAAEPYGAPKPTPPRGEPVSATDLEAWRNAVHGVGRVAVGVTGADALADATADALGKGGAWPAASSAPPPVELPSADARAEIYELSSDLPAGAARATVAVYTQRASQAVAIAGALADPRGALASRLAALEGAPKVRDVATTAHVGGGCVAVTLEWSSRELASDGAARVATGVALARQELAVELSETPADATFARAIAHAADDPRDAAERAAWWSFATDRDDAALRTATAIGLAIGKDTPGDGAFARASRDLRSALDRAVISWHEPVVEGRSRVERGQGELWLLLGSPCGTFAESEGDAGIGGLVAGAAAEHVNDALRGEGARAEGWAAQDGVGVLVHGAARAGEAPRAHARRLADAAARAFAAETLPSHTIARARAQVLARILEQDGARSLAVLAGALAPGRPSWILPWGSSEPVGRVSDASVAARAAVFRAGPLRVAVLANVDVVQAQTAAQAIDRWVARHPGEARACPAVSPPPAARPGTYVADATSGAAEAWIAAPLANADDDAREAAAVLAAALDGDGGLLARALGETGLVRASSARVVGGARAPALVIRLTTPPGSLDAAVAQTRGLLDRLRQGALTDADRQRALTVRDQRGVPATLDPRARLIALFRDERPRPAPSLDTLRALAASALRDEALVIVAAQPRSPR